MSDAQIKRALAAPVAPPFNVVVAARSPRRLRRVRAAFLALLLVGAGAASFALRRQEPEVGIVLSEPQTTDWLLDTPDPEWLASLEDSSKETP